MAGSSQLNGPQNAGSLSGLPRRGTVPAHLFAYELTHRVINRSGWSAAQDPVVCHTRDFHGCTNPAHLRLGTAAENRAEWSLRRLNPQGPLADVRGAAGHTRAIAQAIRAGLRAGEPPELIVGLRPQEATPRITRDLSLTRDRDNEQDDREQHHEGAPDDEHAFRPQAFPPVDDNISRVGRIVGDKYVAAVNERLSPSGGNGTDHFHHSVVLRHELEQRAWRGRLLRSLSRASLDQRLDTHARPGHTPCLAQPIRPREDGQHAAERGDPREYGHDPHVHATPPFRCSSPPRPPSPTPSHCGHTSPARSWLSSTTLTRS